MVREAELDAVFGALSDPIRRHILERLGYGALTAGQISAGFAVSQPAISKHLKVLERSGLVKRTVVGRQHHLRLSARAMRGAADWLEKYERFWNQSLDRLEDYLTQSSDQRTSQ